MAEFAVMSMLAGLIFGAVDSHFIWLFIAGLITAIWKGEKSV